MLDVLKFFVLAKEKKGTVAWYKYVPGRTFANIGASFFILIISLSCVYLCEFPVDAIIFDSM